MTDRQELHKFIVEKLGGCWHERFKESQLPPFKGKRCKKCGSRNLNPNLDTPDGFMWVWGKLREDRNRWGDFENWLIATCPHSGFNDNEKFLAMLTPLIDNPSHFIDAVGDFLKQEV